MIFPVVGCLNLQHQCTIHIVCQFRVQVLCGHHLSSIMTVRRRSIRQLMLEKQLVTKPAVSATKDHIYGVVDRLGCIQIDTINVIERAHYMTLWSRLGCYDKNLLHELAYKERKLFEHWAHGVCFIPFKDYRYYTSQMQRRGKTMRADFTRRSKEDPSILDEVLERVTNEGPLSTRDFEGSGGPGGWWSWKPAKLALELLYRSGHLLIHHRHNFQKYYDLTENVLPSNIDITQPSEDERVTYFILKTFEALGSVKPQEIRDYYHNNSLKLGTPKQILERLEKHHSEGLVERHSVEGDQNPYFCLPGDYVRLQELEAGDFQHDAVSLHIYFDNLLWLRKRVQFLFNFKPKLEVYLPKTKRVYGYYHLPVLYGDQLVARVEPKMDRKNGVLIIRGYWVERGFKPSEDYKDKLHGCLDSLAEFHVAEKFSWQI